MVDVSVFKKNGKILMLALDHRGSLKKLLRPHDPESTSSREMVDFKKAILSTVGKQASGVLLDINYGIDAYKQLNSTMPAVFAIDKSGYVGSESERITEVAYTAGDLKNLGALGTKLLVQVNPTKRSFETQLEVAKKVLDDAHANELPLFLEFVNYDMEPQVPETLKLFLEAGINPDVYKLEYPGNLEKSMEVTNMLGNIPWILLTKGVDFPEFKERLTTSIKGGCSGFLAGRALWKELPTVADKQLFLDETLPTRFKEIVEICS